MAINIFISYRREDSFQYAEIIYEKLVNKHGNDQVFMDTSSIIPGSEWPQEIEIALNESSIFFVIIGPQWFDVGINEFRQRAIDRKDDWVKREILHAIKSEKRIIPLLVGGATMPPKVALPDCICILSEKQAVRIRDSFFEEDIQKKLINKIWPSSIISIEPMLPFGDYTDKVGRIDELNWLKYKFENENIAILCGVAGIGKTFLSGIFATSEFKEIGYLSVFVGERNVEEVAFEILSYFKYQGREPKSKQEANNLLRQYVTSSYNGLLVLDNVESTSVKFLIPGGKVKTLITTRHRNIAIKVSNKNNVIELSEFSSEECIELFANYINISNRNDLVKLSKFLGYLPYLIRLSATLLFEDSTLRPTDLVEQYGNTEDPIQDVHNVVSELLSKSYNFLNDSEKELLLCLGCCSLKGIHLDLFCDIFEFSYDKYRRLLIKPNRLNLLEVSKESILKIHPLTKLFLKLEDSDNSKQDKYLKGLNIYLQQHEDSIDYLFINEVRSCYEDIDKDKINIYFDIIDGLLSNKLTRYIFADIIEKLISTATEIGYPTSEYINYYYETAKQFKLISQYEESKKYIDKFIEHYRKL